MYNQSADNPFLLHVEKNHKENVRFSYTFKIMPKYSQKSQEKPFENLHNKLGTIKSFLEHILLYIAVQ